MQDSKDEELLNNPPELDGCPDMVAMTYMGERHVLHNLECRYYQRDDYPDIYTHMSNILVAVNPYQPCPNYTDKEIQTNKDYKGSGSKPEPHIFGISSRAYKALMFYKRNQSILVCGESGSGKTENAKFALKYLTATCPIKELPLDSVDEYGEQFGIEHQILAMNPLLEAFGNAQTLMNNNSSRFAKFTKVVFSHFKKKLSKGERQACMIIGSFIETYLLEKSRVCQQDKGEKNFHIFYQIYNLSEADRKKLDIRPKKKFKYFNKIFPTVLAPGQKDMYSKESFKEVQTALNMLHISKDEQGQVWGIVCGVLHLGNIEFKKNAQEYAIVPEDDPHLLSAAKLFHVAPKKLAETLVTKSIKVRFQTIKKTLEERDALINRDSISKAVYSGLFQYLVWRMNRRLLARDEEKDGDNDEEVADTVREEDEYDGQATLENPFIGILDVFGFESFQTNSFEQYCINFANESLQQFFNEYVVESEQKEYTKEGVYWTPIEVPDARQCIKLLHRGFSELDSTCRMPQGNPEKFATNLYAQNKDHKYLLKVHAGQQRRSAKPSGKRQKNQRYGKFSGFAIQHYAAQVVYSADEFLNKNQDNTSPDVVKLFRNHSTAAIVQQLIVKDQHDSDEEDEDTIKARAKTTFQSVGSTFARQMDELMGYLKETDPHFVRCVNPNDVKKPKRFDFEYVLPQLRCGGLIQALNVMKLGYPTRISYNQIHKMYRSSKIRKQLSKLNPNEFLEAVMVAYGIDKSNYQLGVSKVFFRPAKAQLIEDILKSAGELSGKQMEVVRKWILAKKMRRIRGAIRGYVYLILTLRSMRAWKAWCFTAGTIHGIVRTAGRCLKRARRRIRQRHRKECILMVQAMLRSAPSRRQYIYEFEKAGAAQFIQNVYKRRTRKFALRRVIGDRVYKKSSFYQEEERKRLEAIEKEKETIRQEELARKKKEDEERKRKLEIELEERRIAAEAEMKRKLEAEKKVHEAKLKAQDEERTIREKRIKEEEDRARKLIEQQEKERDEARKRLELEYQERQQIAADEALVREKEAAARLLRIEEERQEVTKSERERLLKEEEDQRKLMEKQQKAAEERLKQEFEERLVRLDEDYTRREERIRRQEKDLEERLRKTQEAEEQVRRDLQLKQKNLEIQMQEELESRRKKLEEEERERLRVEMERQKRIDEIEAARQAEYEKMNQERLELAKQEAEERRSNTEQRQQEKDLHDQRIKDEWDQEKAEMEKMRQDLEREIEERRRELEKSFNLRREELEQSVETDRREREKRWHVRIESEEEEHADRLKQEEKRRRKRWEHEDEDRLEEDRIRKDKIRKEDEAIQLSDAQRAEKIAREDEQRTTEEERMQKEIKDEWYKIEKMREQVAQELNNRRQELEEEMNIRRQKLEQTEKEAARKQVEMLEQLESDDKSRVESLKKLEEEREVAYNHRREELEGELADRRKQLEGDLEKRRDSLAVSEVEAKERATAIEKEARDRIIAQDQQRQALFDREEEERLKREAARLREIEQEDESRKKRFEDEDRERKLLIKSEDDRRKEQYAAFLKKLEVEEQEHKEEREKEDKIRRQLMDEELQRRRADLEGELKQRREKLESQMEIREKTFDEEMADVRKQNESELEAKEQKWREKVKEEEEEQRRRFKEREARIYREDKKRKERIQRENQERYERAKERLERHAKEDEEREERIRRDDEARGQAIAEEDNIRKERWRQEDQARKMRRTREKEAIKRAVLERAKPVQLGGWLLKQGGSFGKKWQKRYFTFNSSKDRKLRYFKNEDESKSNSSAAGDIDLSYVTSVGTLDGVSGADKFPPHCIALTTVERVWYVAAAKRDQAELWTQQLTKALVQIRPDIEQSITVSPSVDFSSFIDMEDEP